MTNIANLALGNSKTLNCVKILDQLRAQSGARVADISQNTAIPLATVYRIIHMLLEKGLILQTQKVLAPNGRQPIVYSINPAYAGVVCIIIEKTAVSVCISGMNGSIFRSDKIQIQANCEREPLLNDIQQSIETLYCTQWGNSPFAERVRAIHVAVEADVDINAGRILRFSGISSLNDFDVAGYFSARYGIPTHLNKLLYMEAVASIQNYYRYSFENYVYLHIGVGFGATVVIDRKIYAGANGKAGELVRLKTSEGLTWEEAYGTSNLYQRLVRAAAELPQSQLNAILIESLAQPNPGNVPPLMRVLDRALECEIPEVMALLRDAVKGWCTAIQLLHTFFDPEVIVIGGDVSVDTPNVFGAIREELSRNPEFEGNVLPAEYQRSLLDVVALDALNSLYESVYEDLSSILG